MQRHRIASSPSSTDDETALATFLMNPCENIGILLSYLQSDLDRVTKSLIIDHIFVCDQCYESFRDFMALAETIDTFTESAHQHINPNDQKTTIQRTSPFWVSWPKLIFVPIAIILLISILILTKIWTPLLDHTSDQASWRGTPLNSIFDIYPFPYSAISRKSLRFTIPSKLDFDYWHLYIFNADLGIFWQSDRSEKLTIIPDKSVVNLLKKRVIYYWKYLEKSGSGTLRESDLIPFYIVD